MSFTHSSMGSSKTFSETARHGPSIYEFIFNDSTDLLEVFLDGTSLGTTAYTAPPNQGNELVLFANRGTNARPDGFVAEVVGTTDALSTADRQTLEGYLANKWGLSGNLPPDHPYKTTNVPPVGTSPFSSEVVSGSGQSLDLSGGNFVTVSSGGSEDEFDGDSNFSVAMWVKGWPVDANQNYLSKSLDLKAELPGLNLWLDANDTASITTKPGSTDIATWTNKLDPSIKMHGQASSPNNGALINGKNALNFAGNSEQIIAYKDGTNLWSPGSADGTPSGTVSDISVFMTLQLTQTGQDKMPFNLGFEGRIKIDDHDLVPFGQRVNAQDLAALNTT